eukprot:6214195-Pleurochrysis_carterae.AAC.5
MPEAPPVITATFPAHSTALAAMPAAESGRGRKMHRAANGLPSLRPRHARDDPATVRCRGEERARRDAGCGGAVDQAGYPSWRMLPSCRGLRSQAEIKNTRTF